MLPFYRGKEGGYGAQIRSLDSTPKALSGFHPERSSELHTVKRKQPSMNNSKLKVQTTENILGKKG